MNKQEEGGKPRPWGVCLQSGSISAVVREEIKEINRILFVLSEHSLESHDKTAHMLFQAEDCSAWNHGLVPGWHRDGVLTAGTGWMLTGKEVSEHRELWLGMWGEAMDLLCLKSWAEVGCWERSWGSRGEEQPEPCGWHKRGSRKPP